MKVLETSTSIQVRTIFPPVCFNISNNIFHTGAAEDLCVLDASPERRDPSITVLQVQQLNSQTADDRYLSKQSGVFESVVRTCVCHFRASLNPNQLVCVCDAESMRHLGDGTAEREGGGGSCARLVPYTFFFVFFFKERCVRNNTHSLGARGLLDNQSRPVTGLCTTPG